MPVFDAQAFLDSGGVARRVVEYQRSQKIYLQGDPATSVMYVQKGGVKLSVVNEPVHARIKEDHKTQVPRNRSVCGEPAQKHCAG